ncbi:hypothetical protein HHK36_009704 [Tetracentron sinense]|uniref:SCP domain-containing protein n=1 Tax=Tetracentron sinense TaxID=13715 RepID=A0A834ZBD6_TETSI|nr:hypothetical protein HHK36_009704 [Tetracentron sinense]
MGLCRIALALVCLTGLALVHVSQAQNSPQDYVNTHNAARSEVNVGSIAWDTSLEAYAQDYANKRIGDCALQHSGGPYGENIAAGGGELTGIDAVNLWVSEKGSYDYNSNSCVGGQCGHYTQVVWRNSVRLGCARVQCSNNNGWFVTCNYDPPGNYVDQRPY